MVPTFMMDPAVEAEVVERVLIEPRWTGQHKLEPSLVLLGLIRDQFFVSQGARVNFWCTRPGEVFGFRQSGRWQGTSLPESFVVFRFGAQSARFLSLSRVTQLRRVFANHLELRRWWCVVRTFATWIRSKSITCISGTGFAPSFPSVAISTILGAPCAAAFASA